MSTPRLVGRDGAHDRVEKFVGHASAHGAALLVVGDPGIGKSLLLKVAWDPATDMRAVLEPESNRERVAAESLWRRLSAGREVG